MLEQYLINHCAPTLASLKTANLFNCTAENPTALQMAVSRWQALLAPKGVELLLLRESGNRALDMCTVRIGWPATCNSRGWRHFSPTAAIPARLRLPALMC